MLLFASMSRCRVFRDIYVTATATIRQHGRLSCPRRSPHAFGDRIPQQKLADLATTAEERCGPYRRTYRQPDGPLLFRRSFLDLAAIGRTVSFGRPLVPHRLERRPPGDCVGQVCGKRRRRISSVSHRLPCAVRQIFRLLPPKPHRLPLCSSLASGSASNRLGRRRSFRNPY